MPCNRTLEQRKMNCYDLINNKKRLKELIELLVEANPGNMPRVNSKKRLQKLHKHHNITYQVWNEMTEYSQEAKSKISKLSFSYRKSLIPISKRFSNHKKNCSFPGSRVKEFRGTKSKSKEELNARIKSIFKIESIFSFPPIHKEQETNCPTAEILNHKLQEKRNKKGLRFDLNNEDHKNENNTNIFKYDCFTCISNSIGNELAKSVPNLNESLRTLKLVHSEVSLLKHPEDDNKCLHNIIEMTGFNDNYRSLPQNTPSDYLKFFLEQITLEKSKSEQFQPITEKAKNEMKTIASNIPHFKDVENIKKGIWNVFGENCQEVVVAFSKECPARIRQLKELTESKVYSNISTSISSLHTLGNENMSITCCCGLDVLKLNREGVCNAQIKFKNNCNSKLDGSSIKVDTKDFHCSQTAQTSLAFTPSFVGTSENCSYKISKKLQAEVNSVNRKVNTEKPSCKCKNGKSFSVENEEEEEDDISLILDSMQYLKLLESKIKKHIEENCGDVRSNSRRNKSKKAERTNSNEISDSIRSSYLRTVEKVTEIERKMKMETELDDLTEEELIWKAKNKVKNFVKTNLDREDPNIDFASTPLLEIFESLGCSCPKPISASTQTEIQMKESNLDYNISRKSSSKSRSKNKCSFQFNPCKSFEEEFASKELILEQDEKFSRPSFDFDASTSKTIPCFGEDKNNIENEFKENAEDNYVYGCLGIENEGPFSGGKPKHVIWRDSEGRDLYQVEYLDDAEFMDKRGGPILVPIPVPVPKSDFNTINEVIVFSSAPEDCNKGDDFKGNYNCMSFQRPSFLKK